MVFLFSEVCISNDYVANTKVYIGNFQGKALSIFVLSCKNENTIV